MRFKDQIGNTIFLDTYPQRIISLVPSQTELLIALGLESQLVGVTKFCVHPKDLRSKKTVVGGTKQVHFDKIKALNPDLIIANKEENTQEMVAQLYKIAPTWVSDVNSISDNYWLIQELGKLCNAQEKAAQLIAKTKDREEDFTQKMEAVAVASVVYLIWNEPMMGAGSPTFINALLQLNRFQNLLAHKDARYPELSDALLQEADHVLLSSEPFPFAQTHQRVIASKTDALVSLVDGEYFSWYGSRLIAAFDYFEKLQRQLGRIT